MLERLILPLEESRNRVGPASVIRFWFSGAIIRCTIPVLISPRHTISPKLDSLFLPAYPALFHAHLQQFIPREGLNAEPDFSNPKGDNLR